MTSTQKKIAVSAVVLVALVLVAVKVYAARWIRFADNSFAGSLIPDNEGHQNPLSGLVGYATNSPHGFKVGDSVLIEQDEGYKYEQYNGQTIVQWADETAFITLKGFMGNSPANPGRVKLLKRA